MNNREAIALILQAETSQSINQKLVLLLERGSDTYLVDLGLAYKEHRHSEMATST